MGKTEIWMLLCSGAVSAVFCALLLPILRRMGARQYILGYVKEHQSKEGTPTMGGIAFCGAIIICALLFGLFSDRHTAVAVSFGTSCAAVGFLDDFLKLHNRRNLGLRPWQKIVFQVIVALFAGLYCAMNGLTVLRVPFWNGEIDIGYWMLPLTLFAFLATVNCVNLTDGLDGLAASVSFWYFAFFAVLIAIKQDGQALGDLCVLLCGALAGYLVLNTYKASVFMGDTGSLGLGGYCAAVASLSGNLLFVLIVGIMFVCSGISVILQVIYYKKTGKRIFRMAPLHHHFQEKGYSESKIVYVYSLITAAAGLLCLAFV